MPKVPSPKTKGEATESIEQLQARIATSEQAKERLERDLRKLESEKAAHESECVSLRVAISQMKKKVEENIRIIASSPSTQDAQEKVRKLEASRAELEKELKFVQQKASNSESQLTAAQGDRAMKQNALQNKKFLLQGMDREINPGGYDAIQSEIRMLESEAGRNESNFRRFEDEAKRFSARLFDIQLQLKQLKQQERKAQQEFIVAKRLEYIANESAQLQQKIPAQEALVKQHEDEAKKLGRSTGKLQERIKKAKNDIENDQMTLQRLQRTSLDKKEGHL